MKAGVKIYEASREYFFAEGCFINELSNTADDPGLSIARARVEPGKTTCWHYLKGTAERYVILEGSGSVEVANMEPQAVKAGDVVLIPALDLQRITNTGGNDLVFLAICTPRFDESVYASP